MLAVLAVFWSPILLWILLALPSISGSNTLDTACQGCELKVENGSVGFSVSHEKVGRFP